MAKSNYFGGEASKLIDYITKQIGFGVYEEF